MKINSSKSFLLPALSAFLALFAIGVDNYIMLAILPQLANDLKVSTQTVGLLSTAYALPLALLAPVLGPFSDRVGRRRALLVGMLVFIVAVTASSLAPFYAVLLVARFINGLGAAIVVPAAFAYVADSSTAENRARAMSTVLTAMPASALAGLPVGGFVAATFGWRGSFVFINLIAVAAFGLLAVLPYNRQQAVQTISYREGLRRGLTNPQVLKVIAVTFLWASAAMGSVTYIGQFFHDRYGFNSDQIGLVMMTIGVVGVAATRMGARYTQKIGSRRAVLFGIAAFAVAILVLPWTNAVPLSIIAFGVWGFGTWFGFPAQQTIASELSPEARGTVLSFNTAAQYLGGSVGPVLSGLVLAASNFAVFGLWGSFLGACSFLLAWRILPKPQSAPQAVVEYKPHLKGVN